MSAAEEGPGPVDRPPILTAADLERWCAGEQDGLLAFDKPRGVVCHPSKDGPWSSLAGAVREWRGGGPLHLVSRLDRETGGLVAIALDAATARRAQMAVERREMRRLYLAILEGTLDAETVVDLPLRPDRDGPVVIRQAVGDGPGAQACRTVFRPLAAAADGRTLALVVPATGRKHQIRAHAAALGHAVAGDKIYGPDPHLYLEFVERGWTPRLAAALPCRHHALCAFHLELPGKASTACWTSPPDPDFLALAGPSAAAAALDAVRQASSVARSPC